MLREKRSVERELALFDGLETSPEEVELLLELAAEEDDAEVAVAPPPDVETTAELVEAEATDSQEAVEAGADAESSAATTIRRAQNQGPFAPRPRGWVETPEESTRTSFTDVPPWFEEVRATFDPGESASLLEDIKSRHVTMPTTFLTKLSTMGQDLERALDDASSQRDFQVKVMTGSTLVLTAGYLAWVLRGGSLLASLLGTLPAWFHFDPLPVLTSTKREQRRQKHHDEMAAKQEAREYKGLDQVFGDDEPKGGSRT